MNAPIMINGKRLSNRFLRVAILFLGMSFFVAGCDDTNFEPTIVKEASPTGVITGKVIDGNSRLPLEGVDLSLIVNGEKRTTQSSSSSDSDLKGTFVFSAVPAGSHPLKIAATGFSTVQLLVGVLQSSDNTPVTANLGAIFLGKTFDLKVVTTDRGNIVPGVSVFALPNGFPSECNPVFFSSNPFFTVSDISNEIRSTTDENGIATLAGLNQCGRYLIAAPPHDSNDDGIYDYGTATATIEGINSEKTISLVLVQSQRDDPISVVATSMDRNREVAFDARNLSDTGPDPGSNLPVIGAGCVPSNCSPASTVPSSNTTSPIKLVFNYPVSTDGPIAVSYIDDLVNPDADGNDVIDPDFPKIKSLAAPAALDSTGTILTITPPPGGFPKNETIRIKSITATVAGLSSSFTQDVYISDDTGTGLNASSSITADNYNGSSASSSLSQVYLEFPEYVTGTYQVISVAAASGATQGPNDVVRINPESFFSGVDGETIYTDGTIAPLCSVCGNGAGIVHRVRVLSGPFSSNLSLADGDRIKIGIDVTDVEGNHFFKEIELTVQ